MFCGLQKQGGFRFVYRTCVGMDEASIYSMRREYGIIPVYKMVDTCAGEFASTTPYFYSTYENGSAERIPAFGPQKSGSSGFGAIRIGQGVEFDYATVHCVETLCDEGYEAIVINNNRKPYQQTFHQR